MAKKVNRTADKISKLIIDCKIIINDIVTLERDVYGKPHYSHIGRHVAIMAEEISGYLPLLDDYRDEVVKNGC